MIATSTTQREPARLVHSLADLAADAVPDAVVSALRDADLVELRLDRLPAGVLAAVPYDLRSRVLATCRASWEGGAWAGSEADRMLVLQRALEAGVAYVDVEWRAPAYHTLVQQDRLRVVLSLHDFDGVPADLLQTVTAMAHERPAVVKVAVHAARVADIVCLADVGIRVAPQPVALIAMGVTGLPSRVLAAPLGSCWTYAGDGVAPGQIPARTMRDLYRVGSVREGTAVYGVAGRPIGHSLSPVLHNAVLADEGRNAVYLPFEPADLDDLLDAADRLGVRGLSVTAPFKADALARASTAEPDAERVGAANTLTRTAAGWLAANTDVEGFVGPLATRCDVAGLRVAVLGAGGAARAVVVGLVRAGARVTVYARSSMRAETVAALGVDVGAWPPPRGSWDVLVNATPVGTAPDTDTSPLPAALLGPGLVYDLVYNPARTRLLRDAAAAGADTLGGLEMLIGQAAAQYARWFDVPPPLESMRRAVARHAPHLL
jgi:3-dehydroquinate dehydratase / shikimate dehydrogenase